MPPKKAQKKKGAKAAPKDAPPKPREITLDGVIEILETGTLRDRQSSLGGKLAPPKSRRWREANPSPDLAYLFEKQTRPADINDLEDKHYHRILDSLFRYNAREKISYLGSLKTPKKTSPSKLLKCAAAVRLLVETGFEKLKRKTLLAVIDHITHALFGPDNELVEPLVVGYLKALVALLSSPAKVESLATFGAEGWHTLIGFTLGIIDRSVDAEDKDFSHSRASPAPPAQAFSLPTATPRPTGLSSSTQRNGPFIQSSQLQDILQCLLSLVSVANAPLSKLVRGISTTVLRVLKLRLAGHGTILQLSFAVLNEILALAQTDDIELANLLAVDMVPLIAYWWQAKTKAKEDALLSSVQVEMIKTLYLIHMPIESLARQGNQSILVDVEELCDMFWSEYARREDRIQLQQDDLAYSTLPRHPHSFSTNLFSLRAHNVDAEKRWSVLHCLSLLEAVLWRASHSLQVLAGDDEEQPRKKRRTNAGSSRLRQKLGAPEPVQFASLQIIPFFVSCIQIDGTDVADMLLSLITLTAHKSEKLSVWALIAAAGLAQTRLANDEALAPSWKQLWYIAARNLSIQASCRAASLLLHSILSHNLLAYHDMSDDINNMITAADVSGPAILVDSSVVLMTKLLQLRKSQLPNASYATCSHIVRWLFLRWDPADPTFVAFHARHVEPLDVINLLRSAYGAPRVALSGPPQTIVGPIGKCWSAIQKQKDILRYLHLIEDEGPDGTQVNGPHDRGTFSDLPATQTSNTLAIQKLVAELLYPKLEELGLLSDSWNKRGDRSSQVSPEKLQSVWCCIVVLAFSLTHLNDANTRQTQGLDGVMFDVVQRASKAASEASDSSRLQEEVLRTIRPYMPGCITRELTSLAKERPHVLRVFALLSETYQEKVHQQQQSFSINDDIMDVDEELGTQESRASAAAKTTEVSRRESVMLDRDSFCFDTTKRLHLLKLLSEDPGQIGLVPSTFMDAFLGMSDEEILLSRHLCREMLSGDLVVHPDDAAKIVERMGAIMSNSNFASCELALHLGLDVLEAFMPLWLAERSMLSDHVEQLYSFFVKTALPRNLLSTQVQIALARLLLSLTMVDEYYPEVLKLPRTIDTLLEILQESAIPVQFFIGKNISKVFGRFILKMHDDVFADYILQKLPTDPTYLEGIALRLFVFAEVAREWPTLLRRCVYHIFETPGEIPESTKHATFCMKSIARALRLDSAQKLFRLFAPQLLYTWLTENSVESIPFEVFGYASLEDLLKHGQAEAAAIMMMRGQDEGISDLARLLCLSPVELVQRSFSKVLAFSIAHDFSTAKGENYQSGESRLRKLMGRDEFLEHVYLNFADTVGHFFALIDQEDPVEKYWMRDEQFAYAAEAMNRIKQMCHSEVELGANQQPTFHAKYLTRNLALLASRTEYELHKLWTPALVVAAARTLFNLIHPALGPLHTCSIIRKVRVLICLAGPAAWASYPLQMLLQTLRPYLVDPECADDALGMSQYLLTRGLPALSQSPSYLAGYGLSTLASLRVFLESSQASTAEESLFKATMSKTQRFHTWLADYLEKYQSPLLQHQQVGAFKAITHSAAHVRSSGNAERGTYESNLLLEILRDENSNAQLLDEPSRRVAFGILCQNFRIPASFSLDTVNTDEEAISLATAVWKSSRAQAISDEYLAWAGRVIGRGFAASGAIDTSLLQESSLTQYLKVSSEGASSEDGLLNLIQDLTADGDCFTAGLAEAALRSIVSEAASQEDSGLLAACERVLSERLYLASNWRPYQTPPSDNVTVVIRPDSLVFSTEALEDPMWSQNLTSRLIQAVPESIVLSALSQLLGHVKGFAESAFPFVIHLVLLAEWKKRQAAKRSLSGALKDWLKLSSPGATDNLGLIVNALLYLRTQKVPGESSMADRAHWLDVDSSDVASAATRCGMYKTALLFVESAAAEGSRTSRRSSSFRAQESAEVLVDIFENIDDPDAYYGLPTNSSLSNVLARLEYERDGSKSLAFRGAQFDSHIRRKDGASNLDSRSLVSTLSDLGLAGLSHSLLQSHQSLDGASSAVDNTFNSARKLEVWNIPPPPASDNPIVTLYKAYQGCYQAVDFLAAQKSVYASFSSIMHNIVKRDISATDVRRNLAALAAVAELDDALHAEDATELEGVLTAFKARSHWMKSGRYTDVSQILSCRETTLSMLGNALPIQSNTKVKPPETKLVEVKSMLLSSGIYRFHQATQESLNIATTLNDLIIPNAELGLVIDAAAKIEAANALWDHGEMVPSIRMLQGIDEMSDLTRQTISVQRSDLLAKIGYQASVAKLEKPDNIQKNYLYPALKELRGRTDGQEAGKVYHQFAMFCDEQLQDPDGLEDLARLQSLKQGKNDEVLQLKSLITAAKDSQVKTKYQGHLAKAKQWLELDEQELQRVEQSRSEFVRLSLENYLLSLAASDEHNNAALRFTAIWLERADEVITHEAVRRHIEKVPTRKFAPLMNQLSSRLLDQNQPLQKLLIELVFRICVDHPYHGMYQIWSGTKSRTNEKDDVAVLRQKATEKVAKKLQTTERAAAIYVAIDKTSKSYHMLALERDTSRYKAGQKIPVRDSAAATRLMSDLTKYQIPPPTMQIELSASKDYTHVPRVHKLEASMSIASGVSAPKIITLVASTGERFKQLVKGGTDDLRQDAIMEQVFSAVSSVLQHHRSTQQRNLGIRTYKVLPLTSSSGLIEFVPNTIPLHEYLMPAHERYHPKDLKGSQARKEISQVQNKSIETRVATYKKVAERFQPAMRYFFMEHFVNPDEWYAKRTAYTRSTAAISILGHVLGLGDRHGHNILLDSVTGEAVHIDLGVAFEAGRILPVPELVPFRLTRDIVDGMGISKTEGVFRRCCEFTLDALREETYSIMTILDVLRYDPLYSWSISPVRMAKLQDPRREEGDLGPTESMVDAKKRKASVPGGVVNQPSEADRALEVVRKKLSKTLSVTATVNDLINQATDERNLAVLYSGWAAYA